MSSQTARRFHFLKEIASGGFGTVYLAKVMHADGFSRLAAVKLLQAQWTDSEEVSRRIRDEARLLGLLRHRNIVDVFDLTSIDGRTAVIMEYLEGVDLRQVSRELEQRGAEPLSGDRLGVRAALEITAACASALDAAYNRPPIPGDKPLRVIHRDIKPSNIMIDAQGSVKVLDFGVARSDIENRESHTQELQFGSVDYMAPERLFFEPETPASDVYSLGATLYEILALDKLGKARGRPEKHAAHLVDRVSFLRAQVGVSGMQAGELESLLRSMLAFEHEKRPTAAEVYQRCRALARLVDGEDLGSWCERVLPEMVAGVQAQQQEPSRLTASMLTEDSLAFQVADDSSDRPIPGSVTVRSGEALPPGGLSPDAALGDELRRGALAELEHSDIVVPTPATGAPRKVEAADPSDWEDGPTRVGQVDSVNVPPRSSRTMDAIARMGPGNAAELPGDPSDPFSGFDDSGIHEDPAADQTKVAATEQAHRAATGGARVGLDGATRGPGLVSPRKVAPPRPEPREQAPSLLDSGATIIPESEDEVWPPATRDEAPTEALRHPMVHEDSSTEQIRVEDDGFEDVTDHAASEPAARAQRSPPPIREVEDEEAWDEPAASGRGKGLILGALVGLGCLGAMLGLGVVGIVVGLDLGGVRTAMSGGGGATTEVVPEPEVLAPKVEEEVVAEVAPPAGPVLEFRSALDGTKKLRVSCDDEKAEGSEVAYIALERADSCMVTAQMPDRTRHNAVVEPAGQGVWTCFQDGQPSCTQ